MPTSSNRRFAHVAPTVAADWIVHEDASLVALRKPAGLLSVPGRGAAKADSLASRATQRWPDALVVHRLDQATSGLMLMARGAEAQRQLNQAFAHRRVDKYYVAIVHGRMQATTDGWNDIRLPIGRNWLLRPRSHVDTLMGKPCHTRWQPLAWDPAADMTRVALQPITGRSHQLRVHLQAIGHPIVGDTLYGIADQAPRMMLHACGLRLQHPGSGQELVLHDTADF